MISQRSVFLENNPKHFDSLVSEPGVLEGGVLFGGQSATLGLAISERREQVAGQTFDVRSGGLQIEDVLPIRGLPLLL